jgi:hypothetical protein
MWFLVSGTQLLPGCYSDLCLQLERLVIRNIINVQTLAMVRAVCVSMKYVLDAIGDHSYSDSKVPG